MTREFHFLIIFLDFLRFIFLFSIFKFSVILFFSSVSIGPSLFIFHVSLSFSNLEGVESVTELLKVDLEVAVLVGHLDHLVGLLLGDGLADGVHDVDELVGADLLVAVAVKDVERLSDELLLAGHAHHLAELVKVDLAAVVLVDVGHHVLDLLVAHGLPELLEDALDLGDGDGAVLVGVEHLESLLHSLDGCHFL